jgi:OOP family OmpA-OmpF porin
MNLTNYKKIISVCLSAIAVNLFFINAALASEGNYLGLGIGKSFYDFDGQFEGADDTDSAKGVFFGRDLQDNWGIEAYYHDLGESALNELAGDLEATSLGGSVLYYLPSYSEQLSLYGRLGVNSLDLESSLDDDRSFELGYGLGLRFNFDSGFFSRLEYRGYGTELDAIWLTAAFKFDGIKDSNRSSERKSSKSSDSKGEGRKQASTKAGAGDNTDSDKDGVPDHSDQCKNTKPGLKVNDKGCRRALTKTEKAVSKIDLKGVNFKSNSSELVDNSYAVLDEAAEKLKTIKAKVEVRAFTDSQGSEAYNLSLSKKRAASVKDYLVKKGVSASRLSAQGFGEANPIADNNTAKGRAANRRVEFEVVD